MYHLSKEAISLSVEQNIERRLKKLHVIAVLNARSQYTQQKISRNTKAATKPPLGLTRQQKAVVLYSVQEVSQKTGAGIILPRKQLSR